MTRIPQQGHRFRLRAFRTREDGGALVEIAFVLPTFFLLMFGMFEFSTILFGYCNATFATRSAVRYASVHSGSSLVPCTTTSIQTLVTSYLYAAPSGGVTVTTTWPGGNIIGGTVKVTVKLVYPVGVPLLNLSSVSVGSMDQRIIMR